jgi:hypothetical protein
VKNHLEPLLRALSPYFLLPVSTLPSSAAATLKENFPCEKAEN